MSAGNSGPCTVQSLVGRYRSARKSRRSLQGHRERDGVGAAREKRGSFLASSKKQKKQIMLCRIERDSGNCEDDVGDFDAALVLGLLLRASLLSGLSVRVVDPPALPHPLLVMPWCSQAAGCRYWRSSVAGISPENRRAGIGFGRCSVFLAPTLAAEPISEVRVGAGAIAIRPNPSLARFLWDEIARSEPWAGHRRPPPTTSCRCPLELLRGGTHIRYGFAAIPRMQS